MHLYDIESQVLEHAKFVWGDEPLADKRERALRMIEEALELAQSAGLEKEDITKVMDIVYGKPINENVGEEAGQLLYVLCTMGEAFGFNLNDCFGIVWDVANTPERIAKLRKNQARKKEAGL